VLSLTNARSRANVHVNRKFSFGMLWHGTPLRIRSLSVKLLRFTVVNNEEQDGRWTMSEIARGKK